MVYHHTKDLKMQPPNDLLPLRITVQHKSFGWRKLWQIWRFIANPPKFCPPTNWQTLVDLAIHCQSAKVFCANFLAVPTPPKFCAVRFMNNSVEHEYHISVFLLLKRPKAVVILFTVRGIWQLYKDGVLNNIKWLHVHSK